MAINEAEGRGCGVGGDIGEVDSTPVIYHDKCL
jgi:hypothetical protein